MSQREILGGERRAGAEANDGEQSKEEQHSRQRYPRSPSSHTKRKSIYNHGFEIVGRDNAGRMRTPVDPPGWPVGVAPWLGRSIVSLVPAGHGRIELGQ